MHSHQFVEKFKKSDIYAKTISLSGISRVIMSEARLSNRYLKSRSLENNQFFWKQRNKYVSLLRNAKKQYFK